MTVTHRTGSQTAVQRDAWIEINLSALERNYKKVSEIVKTNIMAVLKADAYGHGATTLAPVLQSLGVSSFGVATVDEGISLRNSGAKNGIVILGATPFWAYESCHEHKLTITIHSTEGLNQLEAFAEKIKSKISVQIKIDTGMSRLGVPYLHAKNVINKVLKSKYLQLEGIFSHLSHAQDLDFSKLQKERFDSVISSYQSLPLQFHLANSYAAINYSDFRYNMVRIGIALYGQEFNFLEPLITLKGRITDIRKIKKGDYVSYERTWQAEKESIIATIPIGYADGVDRKLSNKIHGIYKGKKIPGAGNITMDQMMFDITEVNDPKVNDIITLLGKDLSISNWAQILDAIAYELVCRLKMRLPRVYTRE